ncbi:MFS transporter [Amycolatopsis alkalitolerans]|uniref:MFS transporter n=1 Tax=Amycolatopsis alkalitolerans TaxID=2547244 RepID=A0A5C4LUI3_9PSEU|nr:MFS transporter [Amycolatopsis alkalitolerans]TNC21541.1 MFS transporter [Amycolatopsis alkalitolerans]
MTGPRPAALAAGIVALEFGAAVTRFVSSTLLPVVAGALDARDRLGLLIAGSALGLFVALPLAHRVTRGALTIGVVTYLGGLTLSATAQNAWVFAAGQFGGGFASGLLGVFGISAAIRHLDERLRTRVVALSSAMWILPALVGPAATLGLAHLAGWRWTMLAPAPIVLIGRFVIARAVRGDRAQDSAPRPLLRTLLVPLGAAGVILGPGWWPLAGAAVAVAGTVTIMPRGTTRFRPGAPAALGAMMLFAFGYFGADSLITVLLTERTHASLGQAAIVLSAAPLAWAVASLLAPRSVPAIGLGLTALGTVAVAMVPSFTVALIAWTVAGAGVGLAYPGLYVRATTSSELTAVELATAVITAEEIGFLLGRAAGGTLALPAAYVLFACALAAAAASRLTPGRTPRARPRGAPGAGIRRSSRAPRDPGSAELC